MASAATLLVLIGCGAPTDEIADPTALVGSLLARSAAAWNAGDLAAFVSDYAADSTTTFMSRGHPQRGLRWIREHYAPAFERGASRDSLRFEDVEARALGRDYLLATARFVLSRGDSVTASGPFTLVLVRGGGGWKIIHDHTSSDPQ